MAHAHDRSQTAIREPDQGQGASPPCSHAPSSKRRWINGASNILEELSPDEEAHMRAVLANAESEAIQCGLVRDTSFYVEYVRRRFLLNTFRTCIRETFESMHPSQETIAKEDVFAFMERFMQPNSYLHVGEKRQQFFEKHGPTVLTDY